MTTCQWRIARGFCLAALALCGDAVPAAEPAAELEKLPLSKTVRDTAAAHILLAATITKSYSSEALCALSSSAVRTARLVGGELDLYRAQFLVPSDGDASGLPDTRALVGNADAMLVGVGFTVGAERLRQYVDYGELASLVPERSTERSVLDAMQSLSTPDGWPAYLDQLTDVSGCARPSALVDPLRRIARAWPVAPACLKEALVPVLHEAVERATTHGGLCEGRHATRDIGLLQRLHEQIVETR